MTQKLNLHIGYHKTGTTSLQQQITINKPPFYFIGRSYDNSYDDKLVNEAARSVSINDVDQIKKVVSNISKKIKEKGSQNNLISHENFLRPSNSAFEGLNLFLFLLKKEFEVNIYVSIRELNSLILSRFKHDLTRFTKWKSVQKYIPLTILKILLQKAIIPTGECSYPYCYEPEISCHCGNIKKIPLDFYDINYLKKNISYPFIVCHLTSSNNKERNKLVFGANEIFPLPKLNSTNFNTTERVSIELIKKIDSILKNENLKINRIY